uniref:Mating-type protein MAT-1 n=2 Tax=Coccidioides posadasii TaxID=199306 RepID=A0A0J6I460_COCPO|nr:alpha-box mating type protein [Coccidioides posadasii]KMM66147.1 mating-type protein MAT-1 [Coccidioides posadasii RMSCC 3488]
MAGTEASAVHRALSNLFTTLSPEQVQKFLTEMHGAGNAPAGVAAVNGNVLSTPNADQLLKSTNAIQMQTSSIPRSSRGKRTRENGKLRPLNSFIAFRSFYSAAFPDLSQKVKSGLIRLLWTSDPFKGKWAILAKAYSIIRDKHSDQVNLDTFLTLNGPFIGIVPAAEYLKVMGLQLAQSPDKQFSLVKTNDNPNLSVFDLATNLSADDVVDYCYQTGYVQGTIPGKKTTHQEAALAMAVAAQPNGPTENGFATSNIKSKANLSLTQEQVNISGVDAGSQLDNNGKVTTDLTRFRANNSRALVIHPAVLNNTAAIAQNLANSAAAANNALYTAEDFEQELRNVMNAFPFDAEDDGYYGLFNPALRTPVVVYNPYRVQGDFDAFDIGELSM